jgi:hypothetical protein
MVSKKSICSTCQHVQIVDDGHVECAKNNDLCQLTMGHLVACSMYEHKNKHVDAQQGWFDGLRRMMRGKKA